MFGINGAENCIKLFFLAVISLLGLGRTYMEKKRQSGYLPDQLEEFRLPVFQRIAQDVTFTITSPGSSIEGSGTVSH